MRRRHSGKSAISMRKMYERDFAHGVTKSFAKNRPRKLKRERATTALNANSTREVFFAGGPLLNVVYELIKLSLSLPAAT